MALLYARVLDPPWVVDQNSSDDVNFALDEGTQPSWLTNNSDVNFTLDAATTPWPIRVVANLHVDFGSASTFDAVIHLYIGGLTVSDLSHTDSPAGTYELVMEVEGTRETQVVDQVVAVEVDHDATEDATVTWGRLEFHSVDDPIETVWWVGFIPWGELEQDPG